MVKTILEYVKEPPEKVISCSGYKPDALMGCKSNNRGLCRKTLIWCKYQEKFGGI